MKRIFLHLLLVIVFSGCLLQPQVSIFSADYTGENVLVKVNSNKEVKGVKVRLLDLKGNVICGDVFDLKQGSSEIQMKCALDERSVFVEVSFGGFVVSKLVDVSFLEDELIEVQKSEVEERVYSLADNTLEGKVLAMFKDSFEQADKCDVEKFIQRTGKYQDKLEEVYPSGYKYKLDDLTIEEMNEIKIKINETKNCKMKVKKEMNEIGKNAFQVKYSLMAEGDCGSQNSQEDNVVINVDLGTNSAEVMEGAISTEYSSLGRQRKMFDAMKEMGECLKAMILGVTPLTIEPVSIEIEPDIIPVQAEPVEIEPIIIEPIKQIKPKPIEINHVLESYNIKDATILHRTVKNCSTGQAISAEQFIPLKNYKGVTQYTNYTCGNRKERQCSFTEKTKLILDLDFDEGQGSMVVDNIQGLVGVVKNPVWVEGKNGKALEFNRNSYVKIADNLSLQMDQYIIQAWVKLTKPINELPGLYQTIVSKEQDYIFRFANGYDERGTGRIFSSVHFANGPRYAEAYFPGFNYTGESYPWREPTDIKLDTGRWYKLEMAYDGTYLISKIDGKVVSRTKTTRPRTHSGYDLYIGSHYNGIDGFIGVIDGVKVYALQKDYDSTDTYYDEWCEYSPLLPYPKEKAITLHRVTKNCDDKETVKEQEILKLKDNYGRTIYFNYTCANRYTEQCVEDQSFDTYYEEWCDFNPTITPVEIEINPRPIAVDLNIIDLNITDFNRIRDLNLIVDINSIDLNVIVIDYNITDLNKP